MTPFHRLAALLLSLSLIGGNAAVCSGWTATPEERLACCADGGSCPMHEGGSHRSGAGSVVTQDEADDCCATSERDDSGASTPAFAAAIALAVPGTSVAAPARVPALVLSDDWRIAAPVPSPPVPKHVLLSVFLL